MCVRLEEMLVLNFPRAANVVRRALAEERPARADHGEGYHARLILTYILDARITNATRGMFQGVYPFIHTFTQHTIRLLGNNGVEGIQESHTGIPACR